MKKKSVFLLYAAKFLVCAVILIILIRFIVRFNKIKVCLHDSTRAKSVYLGENWNIKPSVFNHDMHPHAHDGYAEFSMGTNRIHISTVTISTTNSAHLVLDGYIIDATPVFKNFDYKNSVYCMINSELSVFPGIKQLLLSSNSDFNELALHLQTKMLMTASSNKVHIIKKTPYVGIAHFLNSGKNVLMQIDDGASNRCVSIHVQKTSSNEDGTALEMMCKAIISSFNFN